MPCHREPPAEDLVRQTLTHLPELLVVDDGMAPAAAERLDDLVHAVGATALHLGRRSGKGHAVAAGLARVRECTPDLDAVLVIDSDGQHPPDAIPRFLAAAGTADLIIGNRFADGATGMPLIRRLANRISSSAVSLSTRCHVPDSQCGMRLLTRRALFEVHFPGGGMEAETRHLKQCLHAGVRVAWVPIPAIYDGQPSAFRTVHDSFAVMRAALARYSSERRNGASSSAATFSSAGHAGSDVTSDSTRPSSMRAVM
jgi:glycosyltransferase involved in cell wall biosynthesis